MTGLELDEWIRENNWSNALLAAGLGVSRSTIIRWRGRGPREIPTAVALAVGALPRRASPPRKAAAS